MRYKFHYICVTFCSIMSLKKEVCAYGVNGS
nr:MAG TPA: hypothetical protein [Inoviridae sp.]